MVGDCISWPPLPIFSFHFVLWPQYGMVLFSIQLTEEAEEKVTKSRELLDDIVAKNKGKHS